jgi:PleD family two-component response regulator
MSSESPLKGKSVLVVDDEPDVLETVAEELDMCLVDKAADYNTAMQYLASYTYDVVIRPCSHARRPEEIHQAGGGFLSP